MDELPAGTYRLCPVPVFDANAEDGTRRKTGETLMPGAVLLRHRQCDPYTRDQLGQYLMFVRIKDANGFESTQVVVAHESELREWR